jgi:hypothetical protein
MATSFELTEAALKALNKEGASGNGQTKLHSLHKKMGAN